MELITSALLSQRKQSPIPYANIGAGSSNQPAPLISSALDPAGGAYSAPPDPLAGFKGTYF